MHKKIAFISFHTCPLASIEGKETGGLNVYVLELAKELGKIGYAIDIYTRSQNEKEPKIVVVKENIRIIHLKAGPQAPIAKKALLFFIDEFVQNFKSFVANEALIYKILHCHYYLSGIAGLAIKKDIFKNIPLIMTFHTLGLMKNLVARDELEKEENLRIQSELTLVENADHIISSSTSDKEYLTYLYNAAVENVSVVYPGVDTSVFSPIDKEEAKNKIKAATKDKIILYVGRIEPLKGIDSLLYAMKILKVKNPSYNVCLFIVGGDVSQPQRLWTKELKRLEALRQFLNITASVKFVGRKPQYVLPYYYNAAELVVMPSHYESFGIAALEAMACGVPVITTNVTGISGILDKTHEKLITSANNPLELSEKIEHLLVDEDARTKISREIRDRIESLTWETVAAQTEKIYKKFI